MLFLLLACGPGAIGVGEEDAWRYPWDLEPDHDPIPFGFWGLNGFQDEPGLERLAEDFHLSAFHTASTSPGHLHNGLLPLVEGEDMHVNLRLTGSPELYTDSAGDFDLDAWKAQLEPFGEVDLEEYIADGTLAHHVLLDSMTAFSGRAPTATELDEMAAYSEEILPGLPTAVREEPADLPQPQGRYQHLTAAITQYKAQDGDVEDFALLQMQVADDLGLGLITSMNIADGGDGSSGQPGPGQDTWAMSAEEIAFNGHVMTGVPEVRMVLAWEFDGEQVWDDGTVGADYFSEGDVGEALEALGARAAGE